MTRTPAQAAADKRRYQAEQEKWRKLHYGTPAKSKPFVEHRGEQSYKCARCKHPHRIRSKIGQAHYTFQRGG